MHKIYIYVEILKPRTSIYLQKNNDVPEIIFKMQNIQLYALILHFQLDIMIFLRLPHLFKYILPTYFSQRVFNHKFHENPLYIDAFFNSIKQ